ncbi:cytochrome b [Pseudomonas xanthosomatis]|uniref:cytochrome b n=1 Tax=Pseudomonas xanthosomatis TaxID=2842356 RepID=UPI00351858DA
MAQKQSYTGTAKFLHWIMALIWLAAWCIGILATHWRDELNAHHELTFLHKAIASTLIMLTVVRVAWRLTHPAPAFPENMSRAMKRAAHWGHVGLYTIALIGLPLSGWYWSSVADKPIMFGGLFVLPPLVAPAEGLYGLAKGIHTYMAWFCGAMVGGHILVALKHHLVDKDNVLKGMLPER